LHLPAVARAVNKGLFKNVVLRLEVVVALSQIEIIVRAFLIEFAEGLGVPGLVVPGIVVLGFVEVSFIKALFMRIKLKDYKLPLNSKA
jgi:hypothetical protein